MESFYKYYSGEKVAPVLTLVIGGNHEASNYMMEVVLSIPLSHFSRTFMLPIRFSLDESLPLYHHHHPSPPHFLALPRRLAGPKHLLPRSCWSGELWGPENRRWVGTAADDVCCSLLLLTDAADTNC